MVEAEIWRHLFEMLQEVSFEVEAVKVVLSGSVWLKSTSQTLEREIPVRLGGIRGGRGTRFRCSRLRYSGLAVGRD